MTKQRLPLASNLVGKNSSQSELSGWPQRCPVFFWSTPSIRTCTVQLVARDPVRKCLQILIYLGEIVYVNKGNSLRLLLRKIHLPGEGRLTVWQSLDCSRKVLQNLIISNNLNFMATRESASNQASLRQGGVCEALGGSSSFT